MQKKLLDKDVSIQPYWKAAFLVVLLLPLVGAGCDFNSEVNTSLSGEKNQEHMDDANNNTGSEDMDDAKGPSMQDKENMDNMNMDEGDDNMDISEDNESNMDFSVQTFDLGAKNFAFTQNGGENPTLQVKKGEKVVIHLKSESGFHDWKLEGYDVGTEAVSAGESTTVTFIADKVGTFDYYCSIGSHRANGMEGILIVE